MTVDFWRRLLPGLWAGWLLCVALLATPAAFALLVQSEAGRVVARMLAQEAYTSLALALVLLLLERVAARRQASVAGGSQLTAGMLLAGGALFCTVAGYFGVQPMMQAARAGQAALSFGQLHAVSAVLFGVKLLCVLALAVRAAMTTPGTGTAPLTPSTS
jgi:hypothetical protein